MDAEELYGSRRHVDNSEGCGWREVVCGRRYSMRFDEAITRGLITDYRLLVISMDGKREVIEKLMHENLSVDQGTPLGAELKAWRERHRLREDEDEEGKELVDALEVAKVKALEDEIVSHGVKKAFVFNSLKRWAELLGTLASNLAVDKARCTREHGRYCSRKRCT